MDYKFMYRYWLEHPAVDQNTKNELLQIENDAQEIQERFYKDLEFGTAGMRGILGYGTNRMNVYTVRKATQGLAEYILSMGASAAEKGVAISYDSRMNSELFAMQAACVLTANGIKAYLSDTLRPVPILSFAVRHLTCQAGIMITASHNPPKYNGYKVYGDDGSQLSPAVADKVLEVIYRTDIFNDVKTHTPEQAAQSGLLKIVGSEIDEAYYTQVLRQQINPEAISVVQNSLKIVYTPLHGTGNIPVREVLKRIGVKNVYLVDSQVQPDGTFPTVKSPNPEEKEALTLGIELAKREGIDIVIGTDPDCDRIGVAVRKEDGEFEALTGNMVGILLTEYILAGRKLAGRLPSNGVVIKTVVTSYMTDKICRAYGVEPVNVLTGFKFIGEKIKEYEENNNYKTYLFGFEESYGYLVGTYCRDKDAVVASMLVAEMAAYYKMRNMTLLDGLDELYQKYGYYVEKLMSITFEGMDGADKMKAIMEKIRNLPPKQIGGIDVTFMNDIQRGKRTDMRTGAVSAIDLPASDVLRFEMEDENWVAARPSGTEPKIKFYVGVKGNDKQHAQEIAGQIMEDVRRITQE